jgi:hypothetical protein
MANKTPLKANYTGGVVTSLAEFESADRIAADRIDPTGALTIGSLTIGSLAGFLFGTAGVVSAFPNVKARAYLNAAQNDLTDGAWVKVLLDAESYDIGSHFDAVTNHLFTVPTTGYYLITASVAFTAASMITAKRYGLRINLNNGTEVSTGFSHSSVAKELNVKLSDILYLNVNDTVQLDALSDAGASTVDLDANIVHTFMAIHLISI